MSEAKPSAAPPQQQPPQPHELRREPSSRRVIRGLMIVILLWGLIAAIGIVRYDYLHDQLNFIKPLIVVLCTFVVLGGWELALRRRAARRDTRAE